MALNLGVAVSIVGEVATPSGAVQSVGVTRRLRMTDGAASGAADKVYAARVTIAAGAAQDLDLASALLDAVGNASAFAEVRALLVAADAANAADVRIGAAPSSPFSAPFADAGDALVAKPGSFSVLAAPGDGQWPVTEAAGVLRLANPDGASAVSCVLIVVGASGSGGSDPGGGGTPGVIGFDFSDPDQSIGLAL